MEQFRFGKFEMIWNNFEKLGENLEKIWKKIGKIWKYLAKIGSTLLEIIGKNRNNLEKNSRMLIDWKVFGLVEKSVMLEIYQEWNEN